MKTKHVHPFAEKQTTTKSQITRSEWRSLQGDVRNRSVTVENLLRDRGQLQTKRIEVEVPLAFVELLRYELGAFGVSRSRLARTVASALLTVDIEAFCEQLSNTVHSSRTAAYRVAVAAFVRDHARPAIALCYLKRGKIEREVFANPLRHINAA